MNPLFLSFAAVLLQIAFGVIIPGLYLAKILGVLNGRRSEKLAVGLSVGVAYMSLQYLVVLGLRWTGFLPQDLLVQSFKFGCDLTLLVLFLRKFRGNLLPAIKENFGQIFIWLGVSGLLGAYVLNKGPHTLDNTGLGAAVINVTGQNQTPTIGEGALAFIALIDFSSINLVSSIPVGTIAAGLKPFAILMMLLIGSRVAEIFASRRSFLTPLLVLLSSIGTFWFIYGVLEAGKETPISIAFLMLFFLQTVQGPGEDSDTWCEKMGILFSASALLGAVSIPYGLVFLVIYALLNLRNPVLPRLAERVALWSVPAVSTTVSAMLHLNIWISLGISCVCFGILKVIRVKGWAVFLFEKLRPQPPVWVMTLLLLIPMIAIGEWILPVNFHNGYSPLDGKMTLLDVFFSADPQLSAPFVSVSFAGVILLLLFHFRTMSPGLGALSIFPFAMMAAILLVLPFSDSLPISKHKIWDLAKDLPNWLLGIYYPVFFAGFWLILPKFSVFFSRFWLVVPRIYRSVLLHQETAIIAGMILLLATAKENHLKYALHVGRPTFHTGKGGHESVVFARLVDVLYGEPVPEENLLISVRSRLTPLVSQLPYYGLPGAMRQVDYSDLKERLNNANRHSPIYLVSHRREITNFLRQVPGWSSIRVASLTAFENLYEVRPAEGGFFRQEAVDGLNYPEVISKNRSSRSVPTAGVYFLDELNERIEQSNGTFFFPANSVEYLSCVIPESTVDTGHVGDLILEIDALEKGKLTTFSEDGSESNQLNPGEIKRIAIKVKFPREAGASTQEVRLEWGSDGMQVKEDKDKHFFQIMNASFHDFRMNEE